MLMMKHLPKHELQKVFITNKHHQHSSKQNLHFLRKLFYTQHPLSEMRSSTDTHSDTVYMLYLQVEESGVIWTRGGGSSD